MTEANKNAIVKSQGGSPAVNVRLSISKMQNAYVDELTASMENFNIKPDAEQISCVRAALTVMQTCCDKMGLTIKEVDQTNLISILERVTLLRLNLSATPREGYMIIRSQKNGNNWIKVFEMGVEGDGNDKLLRKYGVGVKCVYPFWLVREGDGFTYPSFSGIKIVPPTWEPRGYTAKVIRVVYPIEYTDGSVQYHFAEREGVAVNLKAHIINNTKMDKSLSDAQKEALRNKIADMTLDQMFADTELLGIMSPAWRDPHSREAMIIRKMRNNCTKPIPKDFGSAYIRQAYEDTYEDYDQYRQEKPDPESVLEAEVTENAGMQEPPAIASIETDAEEVRMITAESSGIKEVPPTNDRPF